MASSRSRVTRFVPRPEWGNCGRITSASGASILTPSRNAAPDANDEDVPNLTPAPVSLSSLHAPTLLNDQDSLLSELQCNQSNLRHYTNERVPHSF